jgi:hypothetical protein
MQILDLTPGVSPISVGQNATATIAQTNHAIGTVDAISESTAI